VLQVESLGKRFGIRWIFRGITFELKQGQSLIVSGRNGAGKSTLLKCIAGLAGQTEGTIDLPKEDARRSIGFAALDMQLYSHLTVAEHFEFAANMRGCDPRAEELAQQVGLADRTNQMVAELSTGMRARVKIALAVQARPMILLLDEPGAGLDEHGRALLDELCDEQKQRGCVLIATNDPLERRLGNLELELAG
jgi:ABC-type multidrug transport system ATPase subunit